MDGTGTMANIEPTIKCQQDGDELLSLLSTPTTQGAHAEFPQAPSILPQVGRQC